MEVLLANEYGFCFGVERAVEMVEDALGVGAPVRTLGPLIHNTQEMQRLECEGVSTVQDPAEVSKNEIAVIRAHGVTPQGQAGLERRAVQVVARTRRTGVRYLYHRRQTLFEQHQAARRLSGTMREKLFDRDPG